jgi:hypothetical protein
MSLICWILGHDPFIYDTLENGTKIRGCPRCGAYVTRDTSDPRPRHNPDIARFRLAPPPRLRRIRSARAA